MRTEDGISPDGFVAALRRAQDDGQRALIQKRLAPGDTTRGIRMRDLFDTATAFAAMPLEAVTTLFADPLYEVRMGAVCVLDLQARRAGHDPAHRRRLFDAYLDHHDRITTWDMVDRAAPSVVGGHLLGRPKVPLLDLAAAEDPLRRRTAITAPLWFVRFGDADDLASVLEVARVLVADTDPLVHKAVGTALKHAGGRDPEAVLAFVRRHGDRLPRGVRTAALAKVPPTLVHGS